MAGLEPMSFCSSDLEKVVVAKWQWSSVTQFSVRAGLVPTYKIYKICQFVGLKKKEVTTIVCVFLRKAPTKKETKILKEGARDDRGSPDQNESQKYQTFQTHYSSFLWYA